MKNINLFLKVQLTSQSPDAQPISLAVVADVPKLLSELKYELVPSMEFGIKGDKCHVFYDDKINGTMTYGLASQYTKEDVYVQFMDFVKKDTKTFYAEFSDFEINRCDDFVKENAVSKLIYKDSNEIYELSVLNGECISVKNGTPIIIGDLLKYLDQFKDYNIQFVMDKCSWKWVKFIELIGQWEQGVDISWQPQDDHTNIDWCGMDFDGELTPHIGLPILPDNISPVPQDLNDLIAIKKGIGIKEAFNLNREEILPPNQDGSTYGWGGDKHNSLFDALIIKEIYNKLI